MKFLSIVIIAITTTLLSNSCGKPKQANNINKMKEMMIRISEIEIDSNYLEEYYTILKEESKASVMLEPGVISIYPMYQKENISQVRILEIYANREAYEVHLKTSHFIKYKTTTIKMVKSLRLIDMEAIDEETMSQIFAKIKT
jgi:quinol monooxygenase YgiN